MDKVFRCTNGVSFGARYIVTAADVIAEEITFIFKGSGEQPSGYPLAANFTITSDAGVNVALADAVITYPANGTVKIAKGGTTFDFTEDDVISIVAQRADVGAE